MFNDRYRNGYYVLYTKGLCRAIDSHTGSIYSKFEQVETTTTVLIPIAKSKEDVKDIAESALQSAYGDIFTVRIKQNLELKKKIAGHHWVVEIIDFVVKVYKDRIVDIQGDTICSL